MIKKRCAVRPDTYKTGTLKSWQFGCNDDEMIEFRILRGGSNVKNKMISLEDISRIQPWQKEGSSRAGWYSRIASSKLKKGLSPHAGNERQQNACMHEQGAPRLNPDIKGKCVRGGSRGSWPREEYGVPVQLCRHRAGKGKAYLDLNLTKDVKGNKEEFDNHKNRRGTLQIMWPPC